MRSLPERGRGGAIRLVISIAKEDPKTSALALFLLLLAGLAEGLGVSTLLPMLQKLNPNAGGEISDDTGIGEAMRSLGLSPTLGALLGLLVAGLVVKSVLLLIANRQVGVMVAQVATDLRTTLLRALLATRWQYYIHQPIGAFSNAVATEAQRSAMAFLHGVRAMALIIQVAVLVSVMLVLTPAGALVGLAGGAVVVFLLSGFVGKTRKAGRKQTDRMKALVSRLTDCLQSVKVLKAMAREEVAESLVSAENTKLNKALRKQVFAREAVRTLQDPLLMMLIAGGIYVALAIWGLQFERVIVMMFLLERIVTYMGKIQRAYQRLVLTESAYWSLHSSIAAAREHEETLTGTKRPELTSAIRLEGVVLESDGNRILDGVDMTVGVNQLTCIVGPSGAGKTTIADVVTGLLPPTEGRVLIDDTPLDDIDVKAWRRTIGYVPQETLLLHDTLLNNVTLGDPDATPQDVEWALKAAGAWEFIAELEDGVETSLGERGARFSGGQRQRLAVARALLHRPKVLILDEATSALDAEGEAGICATLRSLRGQYTILAIAHTRALMEAADVIYHVEKGRVVKRSAGADLLADGVPGGDKIS